jgi:hypothetical protein
MCSRDGMINFLLPLRKKNGIECSNFSQGNQIVARLYKRDNIIEFRNAMFVSFNGNSTDVLV